LLEETENMLGVVDKTLVPTALKSPDQSRSNLIALPLCPVFDQDWLKRFMIGPWKEDGKSLNSSKSADVQTKEREIYAKLIGRL
jgi:hypothetical protein